jgi:hypothetical protein
MALTRLELDLNRDIDMADPSESREFSQWRTAVEKQWKKASIYPEFSDDLASLLATRTTVQDLILGRVDRSSEAVIGFLNKYKLPRSVFPVLASYVYTEHLDFALLDEPFKIYPLEYQTVLESISNPLDRDEAEQFFRPGEGVYLRISPHIYNKQQILDYVDTNWSDIEAKLKNQGYKKQVVRHDNETIANELMLALSTKGLRSAKISKILNRLQEDNGLALGVTYTTELVGQTLDRLKKRTNL